MAAAIVAEKVVEGRFYILTHESTAPAFAERAQRILNGQSRVQPEGGPVSFMR